MESSLHIQVKDRVYGEVVLKAPKGFPLKCYLGLKGSLLSCKGGLVHEGSFPSIKQGVLKGCPSKRREPLNILP
jgi:hypothetical protein